MYKNLCFGQGFSHFMHTKHILIGTVIVTIVGVFLTLNGTRPIESPPATPTPSVQTETVTAKEVSNETTALQPRAEQTAASAPTSTLKNVPITLPASNVTLSIAGNSYAAFAPQGSTVIDAMRALASTSDFTFAGKDYPSLGFFVDSINGKTAESGYSWILYVNGKLSGTGASQTTLKAGDAIEWRYEKNY